MNCIAEAAWLQTKDSTMPQMQIGDKNCGLKWTQISAHLHCKTTLCSDSYITSVAQSLILPVRGMVHQLHLPIYTWWWGCLWCHLPLPPSSVWQPVLTKVIVDTLLASASTLTQYAVQELIIKTPEPCRAAMHGCCFVTVHTSRYERPRYID